MYINEKLLIGKNDKKEVYLLPKMANRHGLITGASGSGKTITLKVMAESFSDNILALSSPKELNIIFSSFIIFS